MHVQGSDAQLPIAGIFSPIDHVAQKNSERDVLCLAAAPPA
jgi:hypothetical protein